MEQKGGPALVRAEFTEKVQKQLWIWSGFESFLAPFLHFLEDVFLMFFGARFIRVFFACGAQSAPQASQNGGKMEQKRYPEAAFLEKVGPLFWHTFTAFWLDFEGLGRLGKTPGTDFLQTASPDPARRGLGEYFSRYGAVWGPQGVPFGHQNVDFL